MATEPVNIPDKLYERLKETAAREQISIDELVRDALERRVDANSFSSLFAIGERNARRTGASSEDVEPEIAAHRSERGR